MRAGALEDRIEVDSFVQADTMESLPHRKSVRLAGYDYSQCGAYFITIRSHHQLAPPFGVFTCTGEVNFTRVGMIAAREWERIPNRFPNTHLDAFILMPDHLHAIIFIDEPASNKNRVEKFGKAVSGSIPTVVRSYKSAVSNLVRKMRGFEEQILWQRGYYEKVIRSETQLEVVRNYILNNSIKHCKL
jgi:REP element-mobilizing transposase RayT